ncbi:MAG TPA: nucleotidyltransferase family protein [Spirochaetota bacterium]|nr:nucleotidyltransferase family protein [Spirochaetota bacterium]
MNPEITEKLKSAKRRLAERYGVSRLGVFGSYARGEEHGGSDVDILIEFKKTPDLFEFFEIEEFLEDALGAKIDLVREQALKHRIKSRVLAEVVYI